MNNNPSFMQLIGLSVLGLVSVFAMVVIFGSMLLIALIAGGVLAAVFGVVVAYEAVSGWWRDRHRRRALKLVDKALGKKG